MPTRVPVACPNCRSTLKVRTEYLGRNLTCNRCQRGFAPVLAKVIDAPTFSALSTAPLAAEKVDVECPGCRRPLKVRPQYLGLSVTCKSCDHRFIAETRSGDESSRGYPERPKDPHRETDGLERKHLALESEIGLLVGRLGGVEARLEELSSQGQGWNSGLGRALDELEQQRRAFAALEASLPSIRTEFEELLGKAGAGLEAERQAFAGEFLARLDGERDLAHRELEQLQIEVDGLQRQNADLAGRGAEAEARSMALESRLSLLEEAARQGIEQGNRLGERLRELEGLGAERHEIREEFVRLLDQHHLLRQVADGHAEEFRTGLAAFQTEHSSIRQAIDHHSERQACLESGLSRLETSRLEGEHGIVELRDKFETGYVVAREEIEKLHELLQQVVDHHAERHARLEKSLDRLDAMDSERTSLRHELECFRLELDAMRRDAVAQTEWSRSELEGLRTKLETQTQSLSPVAPATIGLRPKSVDAYSLPTANGVAPSTWPPQSSLDHLALDLVLDQNFRPDERSKSERPATILETSSNGAGAQETSSPKRPPASQDIMAEYQRLGEQFARSMSRADRAELIATGRKLVAFTSDHFRDQPLEQALWLRNLGVSLLKGGEPAEARTLLHRALDLCQDDRESDQSPRAVCLIDLSESYMAGGDRRQASDLCQQALTILRKTSLGTKNPLFLRAQGCMARIGASEPGPSALKTISILA